VARSHPVPSLRKKIKRVLYQSYKYGLFEHMGFCWKIISVCFSGFARAVCWFCVITTTLQCWFDFQARCCPWAMALSSTSQQRQPRKPWRNCRYHTILLLATFLYNTGVNTRPVGQIRPATSFYVAPDDLERHVIPFSSRNWRKMSRAFILKVSN